jgi:hypothetical protein
MKICFQDHHQHNAKLVQWNLPAQEDNISHIGTDNIQVTYRRYHLSILQHRLAQNLHFIHIHQEITTTSIIKIICLAGTIMIIHLHLMLHAQNPFLRIHHHHRRRRRRRPGKIKVSAARNLIIMMMKRIYPSLCSHSSCHVVQPQN